MTAAGTRRMAQQPQPLPVHKRRDRFDPVPELGRLRAESPLVKLDLSTGPSSQVGWLATGHDEVRAVLGDSHRFSTLPPADSEADSRRLVQIGNLLHYDPPEHTRLRQMLIPEFTVRRMRRLEPLVERIVASRLEVLAGAGPPADLMRHFAWPIPGLVACELLGVPRDDQAELARNLELSRGGGRGGGISRARQLAGGKAFTAYMAKHAAGKRRDPGEDMLGMLVREHGADLTDEELAGIGASVMGAGFENVSGALGLGTLALLEHPDQLALLRERPELLDPAVEELLRYASVIPTASPRTARADVPLAGQLVRPGEQVICSLIAVNRPDPGTARDRFDITREPVPHMAFGHGVHHCLGAPLARMELRIAYRALLRRFPTLRLAVPPEEIRFRPPASRNYAVESLPVSW
jgi:cytochrome P450